MDEAALQKYWDACLIKAWRERRKLSSAVSMWQSITGKDFKEYRDKLKRAPTEGFPGNIEARVFVDARLRKISEYLWDHPPEKDVELLRSLQKSSYDTAKTNQSNKMMSDLNYEMQKLSKNRSKMALAYRKYKNRNHSTDWNVTK